MKKVKVDDTACIRCGACMQIAPDVFCYGADGASSPKVDMVEDDNKAAIEAMESCPTSAITLEEAGECKCENCNCNPCTCGEECHCEGCGDEK